MTKYEGVLSEKLPFLFFFEKIFAHYYLIP